MIEFHTIWIDPCEAARDIREGFGLEKAPVVKPEPGKTKFSILGQHRAGTRPRPGGQGRGWEGPDLINDALLEHVHRRSTPCGKGL
jgi:hypothetical protein